MTTQIPTEKIPEQKPKSTGGQLGRILSTIIGAAFGIYCGIYLLIPMALAFGTLWLLNKIPTSPTAFRPAWAVQAGQALWMALGGVLTGTWSQVGFDIIVLTAGLIWLWARPGLGPVIMLGIYQLWAIAINTIALLNAPIASVEHKALVAHLFFRVAAICFLIAGYVKTRKQLDSRSGSLRP